MIVVTGAKGFLGSYCVQELSKLGFSLFFTTSNKMALGGAGSHDFHYLNLEDPESFDVLPDTIDAIVHLAAAIPQKKEVIPLSKFMDINALGTKSLLAAAAKRGCKRFIYASTQMVIEKPFYLPVDETHPFVLLSDYGLSKAVGEKYCLSYAGSSNMNVVSLRFARIYGAGENPGFVLTNFIERAQKGLPLIVHGSGKIVRDLLYVKDATMAIVHALHSDALGVYNIGSGKGVSIKELAESISGVFSNRNAPVEFRHEDEGEDYYMSIEKAQSELGFVPHYSLQEGLTDYKAELLKMKETVL